MIILHVQQDLEDVLGSIKARVLNLTQLYMQGLSRMPNMSDDSIGLNNA